MNLDEEMSDLKNNYEWELKLEVSLKANAVTSDIINQGSQTYFGLWFEQN